MGSYVSAPHNQSFVFVPASAKQVSFVTSLVKEREVDSEHRADVLLMAKSGEMSKHAASEEISFLLKQPKRKQQAVASSVVITEGFYWDPQGEKVYKVVQSKAGNQYAKVMTPASTEHGKGSWTYAPGAMKAAGTWTKMDGEFAASIGKKIGYCCCCGAMLTDPKSVAAGIGPICAKKF